MKKRKLEKPTFVDIEASEDESSSYLDDMSEEVDGLSSISEQEYKPKDWNKFTDELAQKYHVESEEYEERGVEEILYVPQHVLIPDHKSPRLWIIRVIRGKEKEAAMKILSNLRNEKQSVVNLENDAKNEDEENAINMVDNGILSVVVKPDLSGYIYIESYTKQSVLDALSCTKLVSKSRISPVPLNEMIDCLTTKIMQNIQPNSFARIKKGKYKNDICQIISVINSEHCKIRMIPRINGIKRKFAKEDYENDVIERKQGNKNVLVYRKETYIDGYLEKDILIQNLLFNTEISFEECKMFNNVKFRLHDVVKVKKGELINLKGIIKNIDKDEVEIEIEDELFRVNVDDIEKYYNVGDEVSYNNKNGMILSIVNEKVKIIMTDTFQEEVEVNLNEIEPPKKDKGFEIFENFNIARVKRDPFMNESVIINNGEHKGYVGVVKDVFKNNCRVLLDSTMNYVNVDRNDLKVMNNNNRNNIVGMFSDSSCKTPAYNKEAYGKTPAYNKDIYGKTPAYNKDIYGKTPAYNKDIYGKTPAYNKEAYGKTPAYNKDIYGKTPAYNKDAYGKTPAYNKEAYGKTPAYNKDVYGKTPLYSNTPAYNKDSYGKTPSYQNDYNKTPSYGKTYKENDYSFYNLAHELQTIKHNPLFNLILANVNNDELMLRDIRNNKFILSDNNAYENIEFVKPQKFDKAIVLTGNNKGFFGIVVEINNESCCIRNEKGQVVSTKVENISKVCKAIE